ncbi:MAG: TerC/Alx family metal homeostasis membrane protein [Prolixibacteraceae bacterium]|nr:TerC/Alx family metal homeostasis membrane protein [Prolixibacteraceae bacterium]
MSINLHLVFWLSFIVLYIIVFAIDMYATGHRSGQLTVKTALKWTGLWISLAILYGLAILFFFPQNEGMDPSVSTRSIMFSKFIAGYFTEYSLSVDNLFVFIMIFSLMGVSEKNQPRLLKLGILLSIVLRILFILVGMSLVQKFSWIIYLFGAILLWTAYKMAFTKEDDQIDPQNNFLYKMGSKLFPVDPDLDIPHFFSKKDGKRYITMFMLVFMVIGSTDVLFAVDSIPAIIGVISDGATNILTSGEENFIAITSNVFAVMGLVSLFFALKGIMGLFRYLKQGVSFILFFIAFKMLFSWWEPVEHLFKSMPWISLAVIIGTLLLSIILSVVIKEKEEIDDSHSEIGLIKSEIESLKSEMRELRTMFEEIRKNN